MATIKDVQKKIDTKFKTLKLLEKDTLRIYERNKDSELIKQKQLCEKRLDEINSLKMEILEAMIESENTEEEIEQWTENHRAAVAIYGAPPEEIKNRVITLKREKKADDAEQEERRIQTRLEEERKIIELRMEMKKNEGRENEEKKKEYSLLNDCKFSKTKLPKLLLSLTTLTSTGSDFGISSKVRLTNVICRRCQTFLTLRSW